MISLYYTFINPFIIYYNIICGRAPTIYLSKIRILLKQIIRMISHAEFRSHTYVLFKAHQIMNIYQLNKYVTCILIYKHNMCMLRNIFNDMFIKHTPSHNHNMRQHIAYKIPHYKTNTKQTKTMEYCYYEKSYWWLYVYEYTQKGNETIHLENILTRNTAQLGYSGIIQYNSMYE